MNYRETSESKTNTIFYSLRRFIAMIGVFLFVLTWHGLTSPYLYWVMLSAFEMCVERAGKQISTTIFWENFSKKIGIKFFNLTFFIKQLLFQNKKKERKQKRKEK